MSRLLKPKRPIQKTIPLASCGALPGLSCKNRALRRLAALSMPIFVLMTYSSSAAGTPQDVVYKESRPMNKLLEGMGSPSSAESHEQKPVQVKYIYDPKGKTDPFKTFLAEQESLADKKVRKPRTYLETLDLSQLELIAIIVGPKGNFAMVRDSKGIGHVIQKGTAIGTNSGMVYAVSEKEVIVREEYKDFRGNVQFKDIAKKLPSVD